jgi:hypothetical protein
MSIKPGKPYRIMNKQAGLALEEDQHSEFIKGEYVNPVNRAHDTDFALCDRKK